MGGAHKDTPPPPRCFKGKRRATAPRFFEGAVKEHLPPFFFSFWNLLTVFSFAKGFPSPRENKIKKQKNLPNSFPLPPIFLPDSKII